MYRTLFYLGLFVAIMCSLGIMTARSDSYMTVFLPSGIVSIANLFFAIVIIDYSIFKSSRINKLKMYYKLIGVILFGLAFVGLIFPTYFGLIYFDENPINIAMYIVNGSAFLLAGFEPGREFEFSRYIKAVKLQTNNGIIYFRKILSISK